jgi:ATP-dependent Clp protease ATP-binding subunit ClpA
VFERFNEHGRQVVVLALDEARSLGHDHIGSEHVLIGLLRVDDELVELLGDPADARARVMELVGVGEESIIGAGQLPFTPNAKAIVDHAGSEMRGGIVGPRELALALLGLSPEATALQVLRALGVIAEDVRALLQHPLPHMAAVDRERPSLSEPVRRLLETAARHAEDSPIGAEHLVLALVLEVPDLASRALGVVDGRTVQERLARLLEGPERDAAPGRDIAVLEAALGNVERDGRDTVTPVDLVLGLLEVAPDVVARAAIDLAAIEATLRHGQVAEDEESKGRLYRFSAPARDALVRAVEEARPLDHAYIGTEHLLLALIRDEHGAAGRVLADLRVGLGESRILVERTVGRGEGPSPRGPLPFTARAKRVLELALRESFRGSEIDTGHLLLAIERDGDGVAVIVLERLAASRGLVRRCTLAMLGHDPVDTFAPDAAPSTRSAYVDAQDEAAALGQPWVGCEHLLLAIIRRGGLVAATLAGLGVTLDVVVWGVIDLGGVDRSAEPFRTARLVRAVETAERLGREAGRPQADERDLLFGLVRESVGAARQLLGDAIDEAALRRALHAR